ncbi:putative transmembrane protein 42-like [Scophthalmus maximus]|uniref:Putative transmembrane protein 42-like n=1 Tax=Scophthalmus maximus TaxID=52904 RepID=A0A2U9B026_SCOMX|nr:putative transmembrane protein 42-like [Scophthalmus maximus]
MSSWSVYALLAGVLSAAASLSAKLSVGAGPLRDMCEAALLVPLRLLCGVLLFACNAVMWTFFSKALRHCSSSARATVTTTASNFISSAFLGRVIFGETHALLWWLGISITLCGLLVLHGAAPRTPSQAEDEKDK